MEMYWKSISRYRPVKMNAACGGACLRHRALVYRACRLGLRHRSLARNALVLPSLRALLTSFSSPPIISLHAAS